MKKMLLFAVAMLLSLSSYATIYMVETGSGKPSDCVWRAAGDGEVNVNLKQEAKTLQAYLNGQNLNAGDEIWIAGGTYVIGAAINPKANGTYYGGFSGKEMTPAERPRIDLDKNGFIEPWEFKNLSILDGDSKSLQCILVNGRANVTIDGLVIQNVAMTGSQASALRVMAASDNFRCKNSIIRNNSTTNAGTIYAVTISLESPNGILESSLIENNKSDGTTSAAYGAGANIGNTSIIRDCVIRGNVNHAGHITNSKGAGLFLQGFAKAQNCLIYNNESPNSNGNGAGAGIYMASSALVGVEYCTIVNNKGYSGVHAFTPSCIKNSIIMDNYKIDGATLSNLTLSGTGAYTGSGIATQTALPTWATGENYLITATAAEIFNKPTVSAGIASVAAADWTMKSAEVANYQIGEASAEATTDFVGNDRPAQSTCLGAYEPKTFAFSAVAGSNGSVTAKNGNYYGTAAIDLLATPDANCALVNWTDATDAIISTEAAFAFSMPLKTVELTANFETSYVLTVQDSENGVASTDKSGGYAPGAQIELTVTPNVGYQFANWKDVVADTIVSMTPNFVYTMPAASVTLKAICDVAYELTVQAGENGTASVNKSGTYFAGTSVELTATPAESYAFKNWTSGEEIISTSANFTYVTTDVSVTLVANFYLPKSTVYLIQPGTTGGCTWRTAVDGEQLVVLEESVSLADWMAKTDLYVGDQLWLAGGTYALNATITTQKGLSIYGGFTGNEAAAADRTRSDLDKNGIVEPWEFTNLSIIDASTIADRETARVMLATGDDVILDGFVAQGGYWGGYNAAGINVKTASGLQLRNLIIRDNKVVAPDGKAIWGSGLGLAGNAVADGCLVENNYSETGGANYAAGVDACNQSVIRNSVIRGNVSVTRGANTYGGGGLRLIQTAMADNCLIYNNQATNGGGVYLGSSGAGHAPSLQYCTIVNNRTTGTSINALGVNVTGSTQPFIANCLIMNNQNGNGAIANIIDNSVVSYCAYDGAALNNSMNSLNVTKTVEEVFAAPTKYVGLPAEGASLAANLSLKNGTQFKIGAEIETDETDFFGVIRVHPSFVGAIENNQVALTVIAGTGGSTSSSSGNYYVGEEVALTATADATYSFVDWTDQNSTVLSKKSGFTYNMAAEATTLTANFKLGTGIAVSQTGVSVYATNGNLHVNNDAPVDVVVYSYTGQKIVVSASAMSHKLPLAAGAYIVTISNETGRTSTPILVK